MGSSSSATTRGEQCSVSEAAISGGERLSPRQPLHSCGEPALLDHHRRPLPDPPCTTSPKRRQRATRAAALLRQRLPDLPDRTGFDLPVRLRTIAPHLSCSAIHRWPSDSNWPTEKGRDTTPRPLRQVTHTEPSSAVFGTAICKKFRRVRNPRCRTGSRASERILSTPRNAPRSAPPHNPPPAPPQCASPRRHRPHPPAETSSCRD